MAEVRAWFTDPISGQGRELVIPPGGHLHPGPGHGKIGVAHPGCPALAGLALDLDAWQCRDCGETGRVSGAWAADMIAAARDPAA
jgi:hypothetical protein